MTPRCAARSTTTSRTAGCRVREVLERAIARGELATDTDVETLVDALLGPIIYRRLLSGGVIDADFLDRLIALVLPGR